MKRLFGTSNKNAKAAPMSLDDAQRNLDGRIEVIDKKIEKLDAEIRLHLETAKKYKQGPAKQSAMQRATRALKQKKMYEHQRETLSAQSFNMEQTSMVTQQMRDTAIMVGAMKSATAEIQATYKNMSMTEIEDTYDDMTEMLDNANEIQELMGRTYDVPDGLDEADLEAELADMESQMGTSDAVPDYLQDAIAAAPGPATGEQQPEATEVDEFGLAVQPQRA